jgi:hypothetical protein
MDYSKVLLKYYEGLGWSCNGNYESLVWNDKSIEKPKEAKLNELRESMLIEEMREKRNQLLKESDFRALPDYPNRDRWLVYRQQLRDFPATWVEGMDFPIPPPN